MESGWTAWKNRKKNQPVSSKKFGGAVALVTGIVLSAFLLLSGVNLHRPAQFAEMVEGTAHRPYVTRMLVPSSLRILASLIPESVQEVLAVQAAQFPLRLLLDWLAVPPAYAPELLLYGGLAWGCLVGFALGLRALAATLRLAAPHTIALLGTAGLLLFFRQGYLYDFSVLLTWVWLFVGIARQRWLATLLLSVVLALNKETALLAPLFWLVYGWRERNQLPYWRFLFGQTAIVGTIWLAQQWLFRANPGSSFEFHWHVHLDTYSSNPWPLLALAAAGAATLVLAWPSAPQLVRSALVLLLPLSGLYVLFGFPYELRVYYELYPIGVLCVALAVQQLTALLPSSTFRPPVPSQERLLLLLTLLAAWGARMVWLDQIPARWLQNEAIHRLAARNGRLDHFWTDLGSADGGDSLLHATMALTKLFWSDSLFAVRLLSGMGGILAVALFYRLALDLAATRRAHAAGAGQPLYPQSWIPLLAAIGLATSLWSITAGRLGLHAGLLLPLAALVLLCFWRAWTRTAWFYALLGGSALSLACYMTLHALWLAAVLLLFTATSWLASSVAGQTAGLLWRRNGTAALLLGTTLVCSAPQIYSYGQNPVLFATWLGNATVFAVPDVAIPQTGQDRLKDNYHALFEDLLYPGYTASVSLLRAPQLGAPLHSWLTLLFFLVGCVATLRRLQDPSCRLAASWLAIMLLPALLGRAGPPDLLFLIGLAMPTAWIAAIGSSALLSRCFPAAAHKGWLPFGVAVGLLAANLWMTLQHYTTWWNDPDVVAQAAYQPVGTQQPASNIRYPLRTRFENGLTLLGYTVEPDSLPCPETHPASMALTTFWQLTPDTVHHTAPRMFVHLELPNRQLQSHRILQENYPPAVWGEQEIVANRQTFVLPDGTEPGRAHFELGLFWRDLSGEYQRYAILDDAGHPAADQVRLAPFLFCTLPPQLDTAGLTDSNLRFDQTIALLGVRQQRAGPADGTLQVTLGWQALDRMATDYSAFVHLLDPQGEIVSQHDQRLLSESAVPTSLWVPGEETLTEFLLTLPPAADLAALQLRLGIYEPVSGRQLPVQAGDTPLADSFVLIPLLRQ